MACDGPLLASQSSEGNGGAAKAIEVQSTELNSQNRKHRRHQHDEITADGHRLHERHQHNSNHHQQGRGQAASIQNTRLRPRQPWQPSLTP